MKLKYYITYFIIPGILLTSNSCIDDYLDVFPEDKITSGTFPKNEEEVDMLLNGVYSHLREQSYGQKGYFGFGILDGATPNAYNYPGTDIHAIGNGSLTADASQTISFIWTKSYGIIFRANYFL